MSTRTTITLDEDVIERVRLQCKATGKPFRTTINDLLRTAFEINATTPLKRNLKIEPVYMGFRPGLNYDSIEALLTYGEGEDHR